ncbi:MAG: Ig-like domain-containing protein [Bryobacteraceae bacterium]
MTKRDEHAKNLEAAHRSMRRIGSEVGQAICLPGIVATRQRRRNPNNSQGHQLVAAKQRGGAGNLPARNRPYRAESRPATVGCGYAAPRDRQCACPQSPAPSRVTSLLALLFAFLLPAAAQTPAIVHILSDESQVLVGRTLQMRAVVRDAAGNPIPNAAVTWAVNQAAASTISTGGMVTARGLATVRVTARSGAVTGEVAIQTIPSRVEVTPNSADLEVGSKKQFQAVAYDADGNPITGVNFAWSVTNQRQGGSSLSRIDTPGTVTATGEGGVWVWATYTYNETFPGLQRQWVAYSSLTLSVPKMYELRKLYSTLGQTGNSWTLRPRQSMIWSTDDGQLFFNASLCGLANAFLNWKDGEWRVMSGGVVPRFGRGSVALDFRTHSVTRDGQILSYEDTNINGAEINRGTRDGLEPFLNNNVPLGATEAVSGLFITRNSYTSTGSAMVRANFRFENNTTTYSGLFRGSRGQVNELLISTKDTLPELGGPLTVDADFGIAADGTAYYSVTSGANRIFYKHDFNGRQRLVGIGDAMLGNKVRRFLAGQGNSPTVWFDEDGTAIVCVELEDLSQHYLSFAPDGKLSSLRVNSTSGILWRHPGQGVLLYANPYNNKGNGVHVWQSDDTRAVYVLGRRLFDQTIQAIESGTIDKLGNITLMLRGDVSALIVARMNPEPYVMFGAGDRIPVELPVNLFTLIGGARVGPPHAQMGGNSGSIGEFVDGDWRLTLGIGERLFGTTMWFGGAHGATYNMRKAPNGDIYFINGSGIARIQPGGDPRLLIPFPLRLENNTLTVNNPGQLDVNGQGAVLFHSSTSAGDNRFFIYENGQSRQILVLSPTANSATTIDGRIVQSFDSFAFDDNGRVLAQLRFRGLAVPTLGLWDGTRWRIVAIPNETRIGQHLVTNIPNTPRASGAKLMAGLTIQTGSAIVAEWQPQGWEIMVNINTVMPNGQVANSISALDVNARGDLLFQFANGVNSMVVRRGDKLYQVHNFFRPTPEGEFLIRINSMDFRDDGTVYFLAVTQEDEVALYEARPLY